MKIAVLGLGKIGLPLAAHFAKCGNQVFGVDINRKLVEKVNQGVEPFPGEAGLGEALREGVASGLLSATNDYSAAVPKADVVILAVPLLIDATGEPDFAFLDNATESLASHLTKDTLVIYETTLPIGTTRQRWKPMLEAGSGLTEGRDIHVVFSPERVLTGRIFSDLRAYPKLVGGLGPIGEEKAINFYQEVIDFIPRNDLPKANGAWGMGSAEAAEFAKLAETTYRDVNIGLANQFAIHAERVGVNVYDVIEACNSQHYSHLHKPGIAVGGHCIPVYPQLYLWGDPDASIVEAARRANLDMPQHGIKLLKESLGDLEGLRVTVFGAAYRGGVKETAFSGVFDLVEGLKREGALPDVIDPLFSSRELKQLGLEPCLDPHSTDAIILQADHKEFSLARGEDFPRARVIVDGRAQIDPSNWPGCRYLNIGNRQ